MALLIKGFYPLIGWCFLRLRKLNYVREGGVFANVADIPSYWAYNPDLHRKLDTTTAIYGTLQTPTGTQIFSTRPFELTPLAKKLGLRVAGISQGFPQNLSQILGIAIIGTLLLLLLNHFAYISISAPTNTSIIPIMALSKTIRNVIR